MKKIFSIRNTAILNELNEEDEQKTPPAICYYPGGFKPPHEGVQVV